MKLLDVINTISLLYENDYDFLNYSKADRIAHINMEYQRLLFDISMHTNTKWTDGDTDEGTKEIATVVGQKKYLIDEADLITIKRVDVGDITWKEVNEEGETKGCACNQVKCTCGGNYRLLQDKVILTSDFKTGDKIKIWYQKPTNVLAGDNDKLRIPSVFLKYIALRAIRIYLRSHGLNMDTGQYYEFKEYEELFRRYYKNNRPIKFNSRKRTTRLARLK